ncbi:MAG: PQQ-binding-like beta-propeller repeat protein [Pirellulaceae bacterium]
MKTLSVILANAASLSLVLLAGCQPPSAPRPIPLKAPSGASLTTSGAPITPATKTGGKNAAAPVATKAEKKPAEKSAPKAAAEKPAAEKTTAADGVLPVKPLQKGPWAQWGGNSMRNNTPESSEVFTGFHPGGFDRKTGAWKKDKAKNILWVSSVGSQTYGNPVVSGGRLLVGTNNSFGYLKRYPDDIDLGCLLCFDEKDGKFLWQHSSEKLPTGRVNDWPLMGICCAPLIEGDKLWFVTSRGEVRCLDLEGYLDGEDDGPVKNEPAKLFDLAKAEDVAEDKVQPIMDGLDAGKLTDDIKARLEKAGAKIDGDVVVTKDETAQGPAKKWKFQAEVGGKKRDFFVTLTGPRLAAFRITTPDDKDEADVIWSFNMMTELGSFQHNMCSCSVTTYGDILFVNTSNGVDDAHIAPPAPDAPSFVAMDKTTGKVLWTDNSPRGNILHGQWSSPAVAVIGGVPQVIFGGGDGWMYSFKADQGKDGKPEFLWKFDANPKDSILELGGKGTRNDIIATPVVYDDKVYFPTGQDPEHGEGRGILWCIDPTKRGDISEMLAVNRKDPKTPIEFKRVQAVVEEEGDMAIPNPNSGVVWKYTEQDNDGDGKIGNEENPDGFTEKFHRSIGTVAIKNGLLFAPDYSGLLHCLDAKTGKVHWTYDMLAASWGSPLIVGDYVYVGDEDGDIAILKLSSKMELVGKEINMGSSVLSSPILANDTLFIATREKIFAIKPGKAGESPAAAGGGK